MPVVDLNGVALTYAEAGNREMVVLLHSSASSGRQWRLLAESLADRFHVVAPDLYGYGETGDWPAHLPLTLSDEAALVRAIVDASTGRQKRLLHLVGHSYGGAVALRFALENPGRVRSLTLIEPVAFHLLRDGSIPEQAMMGEVYALARTISDSVAAGVPDDGMARFVDYWNGAGAWSRLEQKTRTQLRHRTHKVALDFSAVESERTRLDAYRTIMAPTLVVVGANTPRPTERIAEMLAAKIPSARHEIIAGAGHMAPLTHAPQVNALVETFIRDAVTADPFSTASTGYLMPVEAYGTATGAARCIEMETHSR